MIENSRLEEELLKESRRTTHAVRAIARFILLIVTYQIVGVAIIALGAAIVSAGGGGVGAVLLLVGAVISIVGLIHALVAGNDELGLSDGSKQVSILS